jgi:hypothetical protein
MDIASLRLQSQQLAGTAFTAPQEIVEWLGAVQAQDYPMSKWAIGARLPGITDKAVEQAIEEGSILRTHVLRPTWHLVSANDIHWMLGLTAPHILRSMKARHRELGLTPQNIRKSETIIEKALQGNRHLTRDELVAEMEREGIPANGEQAAHYMVHAELQALICCGAVNGNKQTYALLSERIETPASISREKALERLARRYFTGHAPATAADFSWWSGLSLTDARSGLEMIRRDFVPETTGDREFWFPADWKEPEPQPSLHLLPAFDEFLISYKSRDVTIPASLQPKAFTNNGIFRPTVVVNGQTTGIWKRTVKKDTVRIETEFFQKPPAKLLPGIKKASKGYAKFLEKTLVT